MSGRGVQPRRKEYVWEKKMYKSIEANVYDSLWYLREDVSKISQERRGVGIICILGKVRRVCVCDVFEIWRLVTMEKWCLRSLYMGSWSEWGLSRPKASGKSPFVGSALHRWMYETARCLQHLIALCETQSTSGKFEACELSPPTHMNWRIVWSCVMEVKTLFFPLLRKGKIKVLRGYCGGGDPKFMHIGLWACESPNR